ncbi:hypothetical protein HNY73_009738 [Argiope bruennichi]|uniref:C2H2-type domain-containing protein n=1 Tax=Argiope bruennichi TaxID=94029 RepID=A0A8T0FAC5_ARGBR|nr:hypothetical protein HNY73_009738 [Argiope bruennichi]
MNQYHCKRCGNTMTHSEKHPCFIHNKFESTYLPQLPVESDENFHEVKDKPMENSNDISRCLSRDARENESKKSKFLNLSPLQNNEKIKSLFKRSRKVNTFPENPVMSNPKNSSDNSYYFNPISNAQVIDVQTNENATCITSSESVESSYRPQNDHRETDEKILIVSGSGSVDIQKQPVSDLFHKTADKESKMFLENSKWQTLNNDKNNFMDSVECVIRQDRSHDNKIPGRTNLILQPDLPPGSTELDNGMILMSGNVLDEHILERILRLTVRRKNVYQR